MSETSSRLSRLSGENFFDHDPSKAEKAEMRRTSKPPSEWLRLLCHDWAIENSEVVSGTDAKFSSYKSYLKGQLSSQLLCRLSFTSSEGNPENNGEREGANKVDFWKILGIEDEFDKSYINAQVEKFCSLYNIRGTIPDDDSILATAPETSPLVLGPPPPLPPPPIPPPPVDLTAMPPPGLVSPPTMALHPVALTPYHHLAPTGLDANAAAAAAVAAVSADMNGNRLIKKKQPEMCKINRKPKESDKSPESERRQSVKREQRRVAEERREQKARERQEANVKKAAEKAAREATREERRRKKLEVRLEREKYARERKESALKRATELVQSNRVPIEITRGAAAASAAAAAAVGIPELTQPTPTPPEKKSRSNIVVSTASDLQQIVTTAKNLWIKYNAIAKEHNQKVNWITVAKELGIHVKVREKYARMYARAEHRGFDFVTCGHYKIKDFPHIFLEPMAHEMKGAKGMRCNGNCDDANVVPRTIVHPLPLAPVIPKMEDSLMSSSPEKIEGVESGNEVNDTPQTNIPPELGSSLSIGGSESQPGDNHQMDDMGGMMGTPPGGTQPMIDV